VIQNKETRPVVASQRNCTRCGLDFLDYSGRTHSRICPTCKAPRVQQTPAKHRDIVGKPLTLRETQIVEHLCEGEQNKEIAFQLHLSEGTIKVFLSTIFIKTGMTNRTALALWYIKQHPAA